MGNLIARIGRLFSTTRETRILMVGLDAAGKTTILYKLKLNERVDTIPTIGFNVETVEYNNVKFTVWDVGGQDRIRSLWRYYYNNSDAIIYVVDSCDSSRFQEAADTLHEMLRSEELQNACLLVFANKQDGVGANSATKIAEALGLDTLRNRRWHVQGCSALSGDGLYEGFDWVASTVKAMRR